MDIASFLDQQKEGSLYRQRQAFTSPQGPVLKKGQDYFLNFCSNDYLGLANDERLVAAFKKGLDSYGIGSGASQLVCGYNSAQKDLEEKLADFIGTEKALVFSNGYMANLGVQQALLTDKKTAFLDRLSHASIIDATRLSGARLKRYQHNDMSSLEQMLIKYGSEHGLVASDSVFSMDGDIAPIESLISLADQYQCYSLIDDAHGFGVLGKHGKGALEEQGVSLKPDIYIATFGKALGTYGAVVAASEDLIDVMIQKSRTAIYTTALPPALTVATLESLKIIQSEGFRRDRLKALIQYFKQKALANSLPIMSSQTAIQPLLVGEAEKAIELSAYLNDKKILVTAIRPPTVPKGQSRLRITLSAAHTEQQIDRLVEALADYFSANE